jgi:hypothetical protein
MDSIARSRPTRSSVVRCGGGVSLAVVLGPLGTSVLLVAIVAFLFGRSRRDLLLTFSASRRDLRTATPTVMAEGTRYVG